MPVNRSMESVGPYPTFKPAASPSGLQLSDLFFVGGVLSSFFTGYLRDHYGGIISYGLTDGLLAVAFFLALVTSGPRRFLARTRMTIPLMLLLVLSVPYVFNPEAHIIEGVLGFRAWNFYNFVFFYSYLRVESDRAVYRVVTLLLAVGVIVAAYGLYQFWIGPEKFTQGSQVTELRHYAEAYSIFFPEEGVQIAIFRPFSTLNSAGNLGSAMFALSFLGLSLVLRKGRGRLRRIVVGGAILALFGTMLLLSGSRTSVFAYVFGTLCLVAIERRVSVLSMVILLGGVGAYAAVVISQGAILGRLETLIPGADSHKGETNWQVTYVERLKHNTGWIEAMQRNPLGLGLGTTGVGIPTLPGSERWGFRGISEDTELGRAAVEMGVPGFLLVTYLVGAMVFSALWASNRMRGSPYAPLSTPLAGLVVGFLPVIFLGNPLYGPPASLLIWSSLGTLLKLEALAARDALSGERAAQEVGAPEVSTA